MASDVPRTLDGLTSAGVRVVIVSDIHVDLRPWFARRGLAEHVHGYVLSYEIGVQKPDPAIFQAALSVAATTAGRALMVGDRAAHDGAAVTVGIPTLLVPPLTGANQERLHLVTAHVPAAAREMRPGRPGG
jgi:FMN phosphatase YigB (HAD superfamily)